MCVCVCRVICVCGVGGICVCEGWGLMCVFRVRSCVCTRSYVCVEWGYVCVYGGEVMCV